MSVTYKNAPLVELVAELRWGPSAAALPANDQDQSRTVPFQFSSPKDEELYMQFAALISAEGYGRFERVAPPGIPSLPGQVACRFRPSDPEKQAPLFQLGIGLFTANALPPYQSWSTFSPVVKLGLERVFEAHQRAADRPFSDVAAQLRVHRRGGRPRHRGPAFTTESNLSNSP